MVVIFIKKIIHMCHQTHIDDCYDNIVDVTINIVHEKVVYYTNAILVLIGIVICSLDVII